MNRKRIVFLTLGCLSACFLTFALSGAPYDTQVADAAMTGDGATVRGLIEQAADVNSAQGDGMTALHWAAYNGDPEIAQLLLYAGASTRATTRLGSYTPLYMASKSGHAQVVALLLDAGAEVDLAAFGGFTPLMMAASSGSAESVSLLAKAGAAINATDEERGQTALSFAAAFNRSDAIRALVEAGAEINKPSKQIEPPPPRRRQGQNINLQQQQAGRGGRGKQTAKNEQSRGGSQLKASAPPVKQEATQIAALTKTIKTNEVGSGNGKKKSEEKPKLSTEKGRNPKGKLTPLMYASRDGQFDAVRTLVELGAELNAVSGDQSTALLLATINGNLDIAKYLVESGADVTIASVDGATPLYGALRVQWTLRTNRPQPSTFYEETQYLDLMTLILKKGADPNARLTKNLWYIGYNFALERNNSSGTTPFWKAAAVGDVAAMRLLIKHGADPSIPSIEGITPLLIAAGAGFHGNDSVTTPLGRMPAVRFLIEELNADVNEADSGPPPDPKGQDNRSRRRGPRGGHTALHNAASRGDNEMILYLVARGADINAVAKNGQTVADMANGSRQRVQPYRETLALLDLLGARNNHKCVSC